MSNLDRLAEQFVDQMTETVPKRARLLRVRMAKGRAGWHLALFAVSLRDGVRGMLRNIRSEEDMDMFLSDTADQVSRGMAGMMARLSGQAAWLLAIEEAGMVLRLWTCAFFVLLCALGAALTGHREMAFLAAAAGFYFLSAGISSGVPAFGSSQPYLLSRLLFASGALTQTLGYFMLYLSGGIRTNVMLQGSMVFMLVVHLTLFVVLVALNRHQQLFLRLFVGVTGVFPALLVAAAFAYSAAGMGQGLHLFLQGLFRFFGAALLFSASSLEMLTAVGGVRPMYGEFLLWLMTAAGLLLGTAAAFL